MADSANMQKTVSNNEIMKNESWFKYALEAAPNGLMMADTKGKIIQCNSEIEKLFGYKKQELIHQEVEILIPQRFRANHAGHRKMFYSTPETRQMGAGRDLYGLRKDGTEFPIEIGLNPFTTEEGSFVLASIVDITKRKLLENKIRLSAHALKLKNQEMEQFVYTVSHDLKSPLVTSSGFLGLLKEDLLAQRTDKILDSVARLERANQRMSQLINDLLQLSRIGRISAEYDKVDTGELVKLICDTLQTQIQKKIVTVSIQESMPIIFADRKRLYQVFENLIINALKYGCDVEAPKIDIGATENQDEYCFFVKDYGQGVPEEYHQKIFGLFQRLDSDNRGTGVGLAIVSRIMETHGGRVWVESKENNGACFWLSFPKNFINPGDMDYDV